MNVKSLLVATALLANITPAIAVEIKCPDINEVTNSPEKGTGEASVGEVQYESDMLFPGWEKFKTEKPILVGMDLWREISSNPITYKRYEGITCHYKPTLNGMPSGKAKDSLYAPYPTSIKGPKVTCRVNGNTAVRQEKKYIGYDCTKGPCIADCS